MMYAFQLLFDSLYVFECTRHIAKLNLVLGNAVSVICDTFFTLGIE